LAALTILRNEALHPDEYRVFAKHRHDGSPRMNME
jgi:hypothetical protein